MLDNKNTLHDDLKTLGLDEDEIEVYLALLAGQKTALQLSRDTAISRSKVYRIIDALEKRSLVAHHTDDRGSFVAATDPTSLGIALADQESRLQMEQKALARIMPILTAIKNGDETLFAVRTYEGLEGFKQMIWHELKAKGEVLSLGAGTIEDLAPSRRWAEKHRRLSVEAGYRVREIINTEVDIPTFTNNDDYMEQYSCRAISARLLPLDNQFVIYNDTVALYHWRQKKKVGVEIISQTYADTMRNIFEHYWRLAEPHSTRDRIEL